MGLLHLQNLPRRTGKGELLRLLDAAGLDRRRVGAIDLHGTAAAIDVPDGWEHRLARALDGTPLQDRRLRAWGASRPDPSGAEDHFQRLARLLELEARAEADEVRERAQRLKAADAERTGECLTGLAVTEEAPGLGGRCVLTLAKRNRSQPLPWTRLQAGSPVLVTPEGAGAGWRGVVCGRTGHALQVAIAELPDGGGEPPTYRVELFADEVARQRQLEALERARAAHGDRLTALRRVLLGEAEPAFGPVTDLTPLDPSLNASQREAVRFALAAEEVAVVHGPPGTGKTTAVVELIRQAVGRGAKVLACAPSNLAVDNVLERLLAAGVSAVRLGHPARVLPALQAHTLYLLVDGHGDARQARKTVREAFALFRRAGKWTRAAPEPGARQELRREARELLAEARRLEATAVERVLDAADVLCATTTGLDGDVLGARAFDLAVIDEAGQATEPACWAPILRCRRVVLAGDHCQLPPTVRSPEAAEQGLAVSLLERVVGRHGPAVTRRLTVQYRMHEAIMAFPSQHFYEGVLEADPAVRGRLLCHLPGVRAEPLTETPVEFLDTAGAGYDEQVEPDGQSRLNPGEARLVVRKVQALLGCGVAPADIAVITPYAAQARHLRGLLGEPALEVDSVDGFQGREKEAVVISLVRSNPEGDVGFLADVRRMNVALTRARRKLLVVGDSATLAAHPFYAEMLTHFEAAGAYRSVWEEGPP